jgi:putative transposase
MMRREWRGLEPFEDLDLNRTAFAGGIGDGSQLRSDVAVHELHRQEDHAFDLADVENTDEARTLDCLATWNSRRKRLNIRRSKKIFEKAPKRASFRHFMSEHGDFQQAEGHAEVRGGLLTRPLRVVFAGASYHVSSHGACAEPVFRTDEDRERFLEILQRVADRYHLVCYAYCLMNDHYHLLLETPEGNLSRAMRQVNGVYGQYFSRRHRRPGRVLGGRFKSQVVEKDAFLLKVARHVVLSPVRAGLVAEPADWRWSSYLATAGEAPVPPFLAAGRLLGILGGQTLVEARECYRSFIQEGLPDREASVEGLERPLILGRPAFEESLRLFLHDPALSRKMAVKSRRSPPPLEDLIPESLPRDVRNARICEAHCRHGYTMKAIADHLNLHRSTVSRIVTAAEM